MHKHNLGMVGDPCLLWGRGHNPGQALLSGGAPRAGSAATSLCMIMGRVGEPSALVAELWGRGAHSPC